MMDTLSARCFDVLTGLLLPVVALTAAPASFEQDVHPLLKANCLPCHDESTRTSGFSVSDLESVLAGGARRGPAVLAGNPAESPLVHLLRGEMKPQMPFGKALGEPDIATIEGWIAGLEWTAASAAASKHWAYQRPVKPAVPAVREPAWARDEIDHFILDKLEEKGLHPAPEADKAVLMRRAYMDLIGLPPSPREAAQFLEDPSTKAYEQLLERLLGDPRYGERWGRHWLDLARYSDTNGYEGDTDFPNAWRYRNYVIDAFNDDKPYDRFIKEQLAGDEFFQVVSAVPPPPPEPELAVALTFLRLAPFNRTPVSDENRDSFLSEVVSTTSSVFLGLTVGCAKCHDHKYDSIPQKDFYRMKAFFATLQIENTGRTGGTEPVEFYRPGEKEKMDRLRADYEQQLEATEKELETFRKPLLEQLAAHWKKEKPDETEEPAVKDLEKVINSENDNTANFEKKPRLFSPQETEKYLGLSAGIRQLQRAIERVKPVAMSVRNADGPPFGPSVATTYVQIRGDYHRLGEPVEPGFLSAIEDHSEPAKLEIDRYKMFPTRGRRMTLAKWIANADNPLTSRVMVNRLWHYHFGRGIVQTPSDFGRNGAPPTHPELLDWLAHRFIEQDWSIKAIHRLIMTSSAYRQASQASLPEAAEKDPDNLLLWRFPRRRLEGEAIRDSVLAVSGRLNPQMSDLPVFPPLPEDLDEAQKVQGFNTWETDAGPAARKRSIYIFQRRSLNFPLLETFDASVPTASCARRIDSITALQALSMYNGEFVNEESRHFAERVREEAGNDPKTQIDRAFELTYSRKPTELERRQALKFLDSLAGEDNPLAGLCRVLFNSSEFVYID